MPIRRIIIDPNSVENYRAKKAMQQTQDKEGAPINPKSAGARQTATDRVDLRKSGTGDAPQPTPKLNLVKSLATNYRNLHPLAHVAMIGGLMTFVGPPALQGIQGAMVNPAQVRAQQAARLATSLTQEAGPWFGANPLDPEDLASRISKPVQEKSTTLLNTFHEGGVDGYISIYKQTDTQTLTPSAYGLEEMAGAIRENPNFRQSPKLAEEAQRELGISSRHPIPESFIKEKADQVALMLAAQRDAEAFAERGGEVGQAREIFGIRVAASPEQELFENQWDRIERLVAMDQARGNTPGKFQQKLADALGLQSPEQTEALFQAIEGKTSKAEIMRALEKSGVQVVGNEGLEELLNDSPKYTALFEAKMKNTPNAGKALTEGATLMNQAFRESQENAALIVATPELRDKAVGRILAHETTAQVAGGFTAELLFKLFGIGVGASGAAALAAGKGKDSSSGESEKPTAPGGGGEETPKE
jgi:hypothetical protein